MIVFTESDMSAVGTKNKIVVRVGRSLALQVVPCGFQPIRTRGGDREDSRRRASVYGKDLNKCRRTADRTRFEALRRYYGGDVTAVCAPERAASGRCTRRDDPLHEGHPKRRISSVALTCGAAPM
jgi:hypothetical protein